MIDKGYLNELQFIEKEGFIKVNLEKSKGENISVTILKKKDFIRETKKEILRKEVLTYSNSKMLNKRDEIYFTKKRSQYLIFKNKRDEEFYFKVSVFKNRKYNEPLLITFIMRGNEVTKVLSIESTVNF